jgi:hypothetical protein
MDLTLKSHEAMDWLTFWAAILKAVAWPVVTVTIATLYRKQFAGLLGKISGVAWGDKRIDIRSDLDKLDSAMDKHEFSEAIDRLQLDPIKPAISARDDVQKINNDESDNLLDKDFATLLTISPQAAVLKAWGPIQKLIDRMYEGRPNHSSPATSFHGKVRHLYANRFITISAMARLDHLQMIRNAAAHGDDLTATDAYRYLTLVKELVNELIAHHKSMIELTQDSPPPTSP